MHPGRLADELLLAGPGATYTFARPPHQPLPIPTLPAYHQTFSHVSTRALFIVSRKKTNVFSMVRKVQPIRRTIFAAHTPVHTRTQMTKGACDTRSHSYSHTSHSLTQRNEATVSVDSVLSRDRNHHRMFLGHLDGETGGQPSAASEAAPHTHTHRLKLLPALAGLAELEQQACARTDTCAQMWTRAHVQDR